LPSYLNGMLHWHPGDSIGSWTELIWHACIVCFLQTDQRLVTLSDGHMKIVSRASGQAAGTATSPASSPDSKFIRSHFSGLLLPESKGLGQMRSSLKFSIHFSFVLASVVDMELKLLDNEVLSYAATITGVTVFFDIQISAIQTVATR